MAHMLHHRARLAMQTGDTSIRNPLFPPEETDPDSTDELEKESSTLKPNHHNPSHNDVHSVKSIFNRHFHLPIELTDLIVEFAEYFPVIYCESTELLTCHAQSLGGKKGALLYLLTPAVPTAEPNELIRVRSVTFRLECRDQGWGGEHPGTYNGAFSWFSACIYRPAGKDVAPLDEGQPASVGTQLNEIKDWDSAAEMLGLERVEYKEQQEWAVQRNLVSIKKWMRYEVVWRLGQVEEEKDRNVDGSECGVGFVESLKTGDRVGLWARAMYPGWTNRVRYGSIEIKYSI